MIILIVALNGWTGSVLLFPAEVLAFDAGWTTSPQQAH
jgi:hypothetical protein